MLSREELTALACPARRSLGPWQGRAVKAARKRDSSEVCEEDRMYTGLGRATEIKELAFLRGAACQMGSLTRPGFERRMT